MFEPLNRHFSVFPVDEINFDTDLVGLRAEFLSGIAQDPSIQLGTAACLQADIPKSIVRLTEEAYLSKSDARHQSLYDTMRKEIGELPDSISTIREHLQDTFQIKFSAEAVMSAGVNPGRNKGPYWTSAIFQLPKLGSQFTVSSKARLLLEAPARIPISEELYAELESITKTIAVGSLKQPVRDLLATFVAGCQPKGLDNFRRWVAESTLRDSYPVHCGNRQIGSEISSLTLSDEEASSS